jgi:hypothetical protein
MKGPIMESLRMNFHLNDVSSMDELMILIGDWETHSRERSERGGITQEFRMYNQGISDAMQQVRLQLTRLRSGIK